MKNKILGLFAFSIFVLVFLMGAVSATTLTEWPLTFDGVATNVDANLTVSDLTAGSGISSPLLFTTTDGVEATGWDSITIDSNDYYQVTLTPKSDFKFIISSISFTQIITPTGPTNYSLQWSKDGFSSSNEISAGLLSTISTHVPISGLNIETNEGETFTLRIFGFNASNSLGKFKVKDLKIEGTSVITLPDEIFSCSTTGTLEGLEVRDIDFTNNGMSHATFGDDNEWFPFEEIEVEIDIKNDGDYDIDDIEVSWGLYDINEGEWVIDFDEEDEFNIKDGDTETFTISFKLDDDLDVNLEDLSDDTDNYRLYVVADGIIDDSESLNDGEDTCAFDYKSASMMIENDFVILDDIEVPEVVQCNANVQITADVWNIGDREQDDVYVLIKSDELGINNKKIEIGDIDKFDNAPFNFGFQIPSDAEEKTYSIRFTVYDDGNDIYENDNDDQSIFSVFLKVEGNCVVDPGVLISASLVSEAKAGKEMVMSVLLTNTADVTRSFTMEVSGYDLWAELSELPGLLTLNADSVGEALFKFDIKKRISGEQTFLILVYSDNELIATQPVSVPIESARPFLGITGLVTTDNAYLWGFGLLNIILIVIIILIAVRIARRK